MQGVEENSAPASAQPVKIESEGEIELLLESATLEDIFTFLELCCDAVVGYPLIPLPPRPVERHRNQADEPLQDGTPARSTAAGDCDAPSASVAVGSVTSHLSGSSSAPISETVGICRAIALLDELDAAILRYPPLQQPMRFGNKAFAHWHAWVSQNASDMLHRFFHDLYPPHSPSSWEEDCAELKEYFLGSFGHPIRIDYGTGHEASFFAFLMSLHKMKIFTSEISSTTIPTTSPAGPSVPSSPNPSNNNPPALLRELVLGVFQRYLDVMRDLERVYVLEPAGSRGVWGLDDYHFLPFLFGAAQLIGQSDFTPSDICDPRHVKEARHRWYYFSCIAIIRDVKSKVPFGESSPLLHDISAVPTWAKIKKGLIKMYAAEVWAKYPVVQHFYFGRFFKHPGISPKAKNPIIVSSTPQSRYVPPPQSFAGCPVAIPPSGASQTSHQMPPPTSHSAAAQHRLA